MRIGSADQRGLFLCCQVVTRLNEQLLYDPFPRGHQIALYRAGYL